MTAPAVHPPVVHAPAPAAAPAVSPLSAERVYVWDLVVRSTHWIIALAIAVLFVTGILIGNPMLIVAGEARDRFVMGTVRIVHFYAAIAFTLAFLARVVWLFVGPRYARWQELIPIRKERRKNLIETIKFYALIRKRIPVYAGHNPLAGLAYAAIFTLYLAQIVTGLALYGDSAALWSPVRFFGAFLPYLGGAQTVRWIHHGITWLFVLFAMQHVYSCILASRSEGNGEVDSIFSGYKHVHEEKPGE